jgi:hypothetical protein
VFDRLVKTALRRGMRRGLRDGSQVWLTVGVAAMAVRMLQRLARPRPEVISEELRPGETLVITHLAEPS